MLQRQKAQTMLENLRKAAKVEVMLPPEAPKPTEQPAMPAAEQSSPAEPASAPTPSEAPATPEAPKPATETTTPAK